MPGDKAVPKEGAVKRMLLIVAEGVLGSVVLAVATDVIAGYIQVSLWIAIPICGVAAAGFIATLYYQHQRSEAQPPVLSAEALQDGSGVLDQ